LKGGQTPYGGNAAYGRTPNPYADQVSGTDTARAPTKLYLKGGKTPAWGVGRTPMHPSGGLGGATPAWGGGKTPNPYAGAGGKTPNPYGGGMGRTPNPYAVGGGKTPNPYGGGGKTPNPYAAGGKTPNPYADGGKTPNPYAGVSRLSKSEAQRLTVNVEQDTGAS
jgi:transcription elongation factor SPT5